MSDSAAHIVTESPPRPSAWSDERIETELGRLVSPECPWPSVRDMRRLGPPGLACAVGVSGGTAHWAERMGVRPRRRPNGHWTNERIEAELRALVSAEGRWVHLAEMRERGLSALATAVRKSGGTRSWASRLGIPPDHWTDERVERQLRAAVAELGRWPLHRELDAMSPGLATAVGTHGGTAHWAQRLDVPLPRRSGRRYWTDARIDEVLDEFLAGRSSWPRGREFRDAGLRGLLDVLEQRGGVASWAERRGLPLGRRRYRSQRPAECAV